MSCYVSASTVGILLFALASPAASSARTVRTTLYVNAATQRCVPAGPGTRARPFCTIVAAAAKAGAGTTVVVATGTYGGQVKARSGVRGAPVVFRPARGAKVGITSTKAGFLVVGRHWVTITGFTVSGTKLAGILVADSSHVVVSHNHVSHAGMPTQAETQSGIELENTRSSLVAGNTVDHNTDAGIELTEGSSGDEVRGNMSFANAEVWQRQAAGIRLFASPRNLVDRNISHDNEDSGIESFHGSNGSVLYENVTYHNGDHGIDDHACTGQEIIDNSVYGNLTAGINVESAATGTMVENNLSVDNGIDSPRTHSDIRVDATSTQGTILDYDVVFSDGPHALLIWGTGDYLSLSTFQAATGQEAHGIQADPLWANPAEANFHLLQGSPAIDSANSAVPHQPLLDIEGHRRVDVRGVPNTGAGKRTYDDRGAYEYQPTR